MVPLLALQPASLSEAKPSFGHTQCVIVAALRGGLRDECVALEWNPDIETLRPDRHFVHGAVFLERRHVATGATLWAGNRGRR